MDEELEFDDSSIKSPKLPGQREFSWDLDDEPQSGDSAHIEDEAPVVPASPSRPRKSSKAEVIAENPAIPDTTSELAPTVADYPGGSSDSPSETAIPERDTTKGSPPDESRQQKTERRQRSVKSASTKKKAKTQITLPSPELPTVRRKPAACKTAEDTATPAVADSGSVIIPAGEPKPSTSRRRQKKTSDHAVSSQAASPKAASPIEEQLTSDQTAMETSVVPAKSSSAEVLTPAVSASPDHSDKLTKSPQEKLRRKTSAELLASMEYLNLKWGGKLPKVGFGFWKVDRNQAADICRQAIEAGYRHLDCACDYGNEAEVGQGIARAIADGLVKREDLWITSKLWNTYHAPEHVRPALERTLSDLGLDYLDLYLIHFPIASKFVPFERRYPPGWFTDPAAARPSVEEVRVPILETWRALEELATEGIVRQIGVSNFGTSLIRDLLAGAHIRPTVLQIESHPFLTQQKLLRYCQQERIACTAFSPLGAQSYYSLGMADPSESVLANPVVTAIAETVGRTPAQVVLRWGVQRGTSVVPKTTSLARMTENLDIFDFELTEQQMSAISSLDRGRRFNDPGHFGEAAFNTFLPIYD